MTRNDSGTSLVEQAIILALISLVAVGSLAAFGGALNESLFDSSRQLIAGAGDANGQCTRENPRYPDC